MGSERGVRSRLSGVEEERDQGDSIMREAAHRRRLDFRRGEVPERERFSAVWKMGAEMGSLPT